MAKSEPVSVRASKGALAGKAAPIVGIDHVAITVTDLEASCGFYARVLGARTVLEYRVEGALVVTQVAVGGALLSVHQAENGLDLVARRPTPGSADLCLLWGSTAASAVEWLEAHGVAVVEGPSPRRTAAGIPSLSVYFRDPDGNLFELMANAHE